MFKYFVIFLVGLMIPTVSFAQKGEGDKILPSAPQNLSARYELNEIRVNWNPPLNDGGVTLDGYILYYVENGGVLQSVQITNGLEYSILNPNIGSSYEIYVRAFNWMGEGESSEKVVLVVKDNSAVMVSDLVISNITSSSAEISWTTNKLATSGVYYDVHKENQHGLAVGKVLSQSHSISISDLVSCTTYFFVVGGEDESKNYYTSDVKSFDTLGCIGDISSKEVGELVPPDSLNEFLFDSAKVDIVASDGTVEKDSVFQIKRLDVARLVLEVGEITQTAAMQLAEKYNCELDRSYKGFLFEFSGLPTAAQSSIVELFLCELLLVHQETRVLNSSVVP
jgi:hypothetical protein